MKIFPVVSIASLAFLVACQTLPTKIDKPKEADRPVAPMWFEKKGYRVERPADAVAPAAKIDRRTINIKPGKALSPEEITELLAQAEDKAASAVSLADSAQSKEDWTLVINQWQKAIALLKPVVSLAGPQKSVVQQKLTEYDRNLAQAQYQASTNPQQIQAGSTPSKGGTPLITTSGEDKPPSPSPSPSGSPSPAASPSPSASPEPTKKE